MNQRIKAGMHVQIIPTAENIKYVGQHFEGNRKFFVVSVDDDVAEVECLDQDARNRGVGVGRGIGTWRLEIIEAPSSGMKWGIIELNSKKLHHTFWRTRSMARAARKIIQNDYDDKKFRVVKLKIEYLL